MINQSDTLRAPVGMKIRGSASFTCQQQTGDYGEICGTHIDFPIEGLDLEDLQDLIDNHLHRRCKFCRMDHVEALARDASTEAQIKEDRS